MHEKIYQVQSIAVEIARSELPYGLKETPAWLSQYSSLGEKHSWLPSITPRLWACQDVWVNSYPWQSQDLDMGIYLQGFTVALLRFSFGWWADIISKMSAWQYEVHAEIWVLEAGKESKRWGQQKTHVRILPHGQSGYRKRPDEDLDLSILVH